MSQSTEGTNGESPDDQPNENLVEDTQVVAAAPDPVEKISIPDQVSNFVTAAIDGFHKSGELVNGVATELANKEKSRRVDLLLRAINTLDQLRKNLGKVNRPDVQTFTETGAVASASWSKGRLDEKRKAAEAVQKMEAAISRAVNDKDFEKLENELKKPVQSSKE